MNILRIPVGFILKIVGINTLKEKIEDSCVVPIKKYIKKAKSDNKCDHK